jgi:DNA-binding PadR family transcriptional regulator
LYRTLRLLEREGNLLSCWENSEAGPSRRTYHLTEKGTAELDRWVQSMTVAQGLVDKFLGRYDAPAFGPREEVSNR